MNVWFTSDHHVSHRLVSVNRWETAFPGIERPDYEKVVSWHDQVLAQNWDSAVAKSDQVWVLGDISAGSTQAQRDALDWFAQRPGEKHLIPGNHDGCHPMFRDSHLWLPKYLTVFTTVQLAARRRVALPNDSHTSAYLSHFPYRADRTKVPRHIEWRLPNCGHVLLHGHTHYRDKISYDTNVWDPQRAQTLQIHVGLDAWNLKPVSAEQIQDVVWEAYGIESSHADSR